MEQVTAERRAPDDPNDIYANPPDPEVLELEPVHPGISDEAYVARRRDLFALCRETPVGQPSASPSSTTRPRSSASGARCPRSWTSSTNATRAGYTSRPSATSGSAPRRSRNCEP